MAFAIIFLSVIIQLCVSAHYALTDTVEDTKMLAPMDSLATSMAFQADRAYLNALHLERPGEDSSHVLIPLPYQGVYNATDYMIEIDDGKLRLTDNTVASNPLVFERKLLFTCANGFFTINKDVEDNEQKYISIRCMLAEPIYCNCNEI